MEGQDTSAHPGSEPQASGAPFRIVVASLDCEFSCRSDQSLLAAMMAAGERSLTVGCRSGGCGVCRIEVSCGHFRTGFMNRSVVSLADQESNVVLACRTYPLSDMVIEPRPLEQRGASITTGLAA